MSRLWVTENKGSPAANAVFLIFVKQLRKYIAQAPDLDGTKSVGNFYKMSFEAGTQRIEQSLNH